MRRSGQWPHDFSCEDGPQGEATFAHSFGRHKHPRCVMPASVDFVCATRAEIVEQLHVNAEQSRILANDAWWRALRGCRRRRSKVALSRVATGRNIAHSAAIPPGLENYVEIRLKALGPERRNSSITTPKRSSSAHSCDLCIGVDSSPRPAGFGCRQAVVEDTCPIQLRKQAKLESLV